MLGNVIKTWSVGILFFVCFVCVLTTHNRNSLEEVDYAVAIKFGNESVTVYVADLANYKGSSAEILETKEYEIGIDNSENHKDGIALIGNNNVIDDICARYKSANRRKLDVTHIRKIIAEQDVTDENIRDVLLQLSFHVDCSDTVRVVTKSTGKEEGFREVIKTIYNGE